MKINHNLRSARSTTALIALFTLVLAACAAPAVQQTEATAADAAAPAAKAPITVRLAYFPNFTHAVGLVAVANGSVQKALGDNPLDVKSFNAGPAVIEALLAGEIDIAYIGPNPAINGYVKSRGEALRIVAGASSGGALFVVRHEANIKTAKDLEGKKLATPQKGGTQDVALRYFVRENGLKTADDGGTVEIIPTQNADILTLFKQGQLDGAWVPEPWGTRLIQEANGEVFIDERTQWPEGKFVTTHVIVATKFLNERPDLVKGFLGAHVDAEQFVQKMPEEAKAIANKEIERITTAALPQPVLDAAFKNVDFTYDPLPETLLVSADYAFELGFLGDEKPDLSGIYDLTLLNEVLQEKGLSAIKGLPGK